MEDGRDLASLLWPVTRVSVHRAVHVADANLFGIRGRVIRFENELTMLTKGLQLTTHALKRTQDTSSITEAALLRYGVCNRLPSNGTC